MLTYINPTLKIQDRPVYGEDHELIPLLTSLLHSQIKKQEDHYCLNHHSIETRHSSSRHVDSNPQLSCEMINKGQILGKIIQILFNFQGKSEK